MLNPKFRNFLCAFGFCTFSLKIYAFYPIPLLPPPDLEGAHPPPPKKSFDPPTEKRVFGPRAERVNIRHIEPNGIGYKKGYSSLDLFLTVPNMKSHFLPFLDLRGHIFNDGKWAANTGIGLRYLSNHLGEIFGINAFYDYRLTNKRPYNQVSMGLEALGKRWDVRANGYLVVGAKHTHPFDFEFNLNTFLLTAKRDYAMSGIDGEIGYHFPKVHSFDFYSAAGPYYYLSEKSGDHTTGGRFRLLMTCFTYLSLEGIVSYDHLFKWIGQGAIALNFPFGARKQLRPEALTLQERLFQPIQHNEIIVVKRHRKEL
jgi:hypothetical protein